MRFDNDIEPPALVSWRSFWRVFFALAGTIIILILIICWYSRWPYYVISPEQISEKSAGTIYSQKGWPYALEVHISGQINGQATFVTPYGEFDLRPGKIDIETGRDYYEDNARLEYIPENVTEGHLTVKYRFRTH